MWTIQVLGGLSAHSPQRQLTRFRTQKAAALLAFLACHPAPQPREALLDLLWPDAEPDVARHNLSNALSFLRHLLEPPGVPPGAVLLADRASVRLNPAAVTVDALEFESDLGKAQAEALSSEERLALLLQGMEWYGGALAPGFYEAWIAAEALRLEGLFVQGAIRLAPLLLAAGRRDQALSYAQRAVSIDPLSEAATRWVMEAYSASGQPVQALRAYRALEKRLEEELDAKPAEALQRLAEQVGRSGAPPTASVAFERAPLIEERFAASPVLPNRSERQETADGAAPHRLIGAEFLRRTTTRFFGREEEVDRLGRMLSASHIRLVTLTGPGGTGKTRLALEAASQLVEKMGDAPAADAPTSAVFVPLAPVTDPDRLFEITLRSLGIPLTPSLDPLDQLAGVLDTCPNTLVVLDNFEQLGEDGAVRIQDLLERSSSVKLLVTSRQRLHLEVEREFHLAPLPTSAGAQTIDAMLSVPSIALFVDRAQAAQPDFQLTERNASAVAQLCDYLEGLPLAIELAAARVSVLSPARILEQVQSNRLDFLATRRRDAESRQKTLRATLDWSYQLLPAAGRQFLASLSVFRGGWTLEAAAAVYALSEEETLDWLTLLRDNSLIRVSDAREGVRFTLLETIREYASEQLDQQGERETLSRRHQEFFLAMAMAAEGETSSSEQGVRLDQLEIEHDNLRAALTCEGGDQGAAAGLRLAGALYLFWYVRGYWSEGRRHLKQTLERDKVQELTVERAKALNGAGALAYSQGDYESARMLHRESLSIRRELGDRGGAAWSLNSLGNIAYDQGDYALARVLHEESLTLRRELEDRYGTAWSLNSLGNIAHPQGEYVLARALYTESLNLFRQLDDRQGVARSLNCLGYVALDQGDYASAPASFEEGLNLFKELGDRGGIAWSHCCLGYTAFHQGDYATARTLLEEGLSLFKELEDRRGVAWALNSLGDVVHMQGDDASAQALHEESLSIRRGLGDRQGMAWSLICLGKAAHSQGRFASARTQLEEGLSYFRELGDRKGVAESLGGLAAVILAQANIQKAVRLWGATQALRENIGAPMPGKDQEALDRRLGQARAVLGEDAFAVVWQEGRSMTWEQAAGYAIES